MSTQWLPGSARMATDARCVEHLTGLSEVKGLKSSSRAGGRAVGVAMSSCSVWSRQTRPSAEVQTTGDALSFALVTPDFFPAKSTSVLFWSTQCELCTFCLTSVELNSCCSALRVLCESCHAHQVLVVVPAFCRQFFLVT